MKTLWERLAPAVKTIALGIGTAAGTAALDAVVSGIASGEVRKPGDMARTGGVAALFAITAYWKNPPRTRPR